MSKTPSGRVPAQILADDIQAYHALATIQGYAPPDPKLSREAVDAARDKLATSEQIAHGKMLGVKDSVCAQYGDDSNEYAALGMKKKSERKKGGSKPKPPEA